jgi:hypothetical protein
MKVASTRMGPGMKEGGKNTRKNPSYPDPAGKLHMLIPAHPTLVQSSQRTRGEIGNVPYSKEGKKNEKGKSLVKQGGLKMRVFSLLLVAS